MGQCHEFDQIINMRKIPGCEVRRRELVERQTSRGSTGFMPHTLIKASRGLNPGPGWIVEAFKRPDRGVWWIFEALKWPTRPRNWRFDRPK